MKEATARVMIIKVSVLPEAAAKGATSASMRICFMLARIWALMSCSAVWRAASAAAARAAAAPRCTRPAAAAVRRRSGAVGSGGRPAPAAALLQRTDSTALLLLLLRGRLARCGRLAHTGCMTAAACIVGAGWGAEAVQYQSTKPGLGPASCQKRWPADALGGARRLAGRMLRTLQCSRPGRSAQHSMGDSIFATLDIKIQGSL